MSSPLTQSEGRIIVEKGTEPPFSGFYWNFFEEGKYLCRRCGSFLFSSQDKFECSCGWPAFDRAVDGAVLLQPDSDGHRQEIICRGCLAHLGHVFTGEHLTSRNTRYCVNSLSLKFLPEEKSESHHKRALFASGCFWGTEYWLQRVRGVLQTTVGYTGGTVDNPTYEQVCSGHTGHVEAVEVLYDPDRASFRELCMAFFETHDPSQENGQGPDIGAQYLSRIFFLDDDQLKVSEELIELLESQGMKISTKLFPAKKFWPAESYHQQYLQRKMSKPSCHARVCRFK